MVGIVSPTNGPEENQPFFVSSPRAIHQIPPLAVGQAIHNLLYEEEKEEHTGRRTAEGQHSLRHQCNQLFAEALSQAGLGKREEYLKTLAESLLTGTPEDERRIEVYLKDVSTHSEQSTEYQDWVRLPSFLLLLAWCLPRTAQNSSLEAFLLHTLLHKTRSFAPSQPWRRCLCRIQLRLNVQTWLMILSLFS